MTTIGFIGLGVMGTPMASNLVKAGHEVIGFNRTPAKTDALVAIGGRRAESVAEAAAGADVIATMLPDSPDVESVMTMPGGVFDSAHHAALIIDFSSIRPDVSRLVAAEGSRRGLRILDAPVSGGEQGAIDASLSIMVGASAEDFASALPLLEVLGTTVVHVGPVGAGQTVKAANQLIVAGNLELVAEALVFLQAHGADTEAAIRVLGGGLAGSTVLERKSGNMLQRSFEPGFRLELHHKDLGIVLDAAREVGVAVPLASVTSQLVGAMVARNGGKLDHSALFLLVESLSGRDAS